MPGVLQTSWVGPKASSIKTSVTRYWNEGEDKGNCQSIKVIELLVFAVALDPSWGESSTFGRRLQKLWPTAP